MVYDTPEQEAQKANELISSQIQDKQDYIDGAMATVKIAKKALRKLMKQMNCVHDFKLKQTLSFDSYKCRHCKFEFSTEADKAPVVNKNSMGTMKFDELYKAEEEEEFS